MFMKKLSTKRKKENKHKGFTLIEMMVSVGLFAVVMTIGLGAIVSVIDGNKKSHAINSVVANLNFAVESMTREIKTGSKYYCGISNQLTSPQSSAGCSQNIAYTDISFLSAEGKGITYSWDSQQGRIKKQVHTINASSAFLPLTGSEISISLLNFYMKIPSPVAKEQPRVFMVLKGTASTSPTSVSNFSLQTTVSQRILNL